MNERQRLDRAVEAAERVTDADTIIQRMLRGVLNHLDLDVAFIGQIVGDKRVFRYVDTKPGAELITVGDADPLEETYCFRVINGDIPSFLADPHSHPVTASLAVTSELPVGSHLSVPIRFSDGRTYGTLCCFATTVRDALDERDIDALEMMAEFAGEYLETVEATKAAARDRRQTVMDIVHDPDALVLVFQPLIDIQTMELVAVEALSRFPKDDHRPDWMFAEAASVGLGPDLELRAISAAMRHFNALPDPIRLNVNVSPQTLYTDDFFDLVAGVPPDRLVVEVTENEAIDDYSDLKLAASRLASLGIWLAIDDVGAGFAGLSRILESSPDELKLDRAVIRDLDTNVTKQALVDAFCVFGDRVGVRLLGEGIETAGELEVLQGLGVELGQGFYLGRPTDLDTALAWTPP